MALFLFSFVQPAATVFLYNELWVSPKVKNSLAFKWKKREWHFIVHNLKNHFTFTFYKKCWHTIHMNT